MSEAAPLADAVAVPAIRLVGVVKTYEAGRVRALDGVDLDVAPGEFLVVTGPSGCGKSTLLHLIAALDQPSAGRVEVAGRDLAEVRDLSRYRREEIGLVFQLHNLLPQMTALENVEIAMIGTRRRPAERRRRALELLEAVDLGGRADRRPTELSGGERQRVAIARALANEPSILLADEPTGSLDSGAARRVIELFYALREDMGVTVVLVTHDPTIVGDRVVRMRDGKVVDVLAGDAIARQAAHAGEAG
jgi:putative ABC transport system ATP-binding protein